MKITEEYKRNGYFWLLEKPNDKVPGLLTVSEDGRVKLEIIGLLHDFQVALNQKLTPNFRLGGLIDNDYVTLEDCYYNGSNIKLVNLTLSKCTIQAQYLLTGLLYEQSEEIVFTSFEFLFDGLTEWLDKPCGELEFAEDYKSGILKFSQNTDLEYLIEENNLAICFRNSNTLDVASTGFNLTQRAFLKISSNEKKFYLVEIHKIISRLYNLFCLAIDKNSSLLSLTCFSSDITRDNESNSLVPIQVYFYSACYSKNKPEIQRHNSLFSFNEIENVFQTLLNNWLKGYDIYEPSLTLYFANKRAAVRRYAEDDFLYMVHTLESLHRRTSDETELPLEEFKKLFKEITEGVDKKYKTLICERLNYGNELSLLKRLKRILGILNDYGIKLKDFESDFKKIKDTRNYLTHYDSKLSNKKATLYEMIVLTANMEALFQLYLLKELGFTAEEIQKKISNGKSQLKHKLGM